MPDLEDLARDIEASIGELVEAAGGRPGIFRRFVSRGEVEVGADRKRVAPGGAPSNNGHGDREESPAG
jgi:hypothetical protein